LEQVKTVGNHLADINERRLLVAEMLKTLNDCLPRDPPGKSPEKIGERNELHITSLDCEYFPDLKTWFADVKEIWDEDHKTAQVAAGTAPAENPQLPAEPAPAPDAPVESPPTGDVPVPAVDEGPAGPGWVIQLTGYHYHNEKKESQAGLYVKETLFDAIENKTDIQLPGGVFSVKEIGLGYPVLVNPVTKIVPEVVTDPNAVEVAQPMPGQAPPALHGPTAPAQPTADSRSTSQNVGRYDFVVQLAWKPTSQRQRLENRAKPPQPPAGQPELAGTTQ
jgi:type IV pilus assembly protein PilM